MLLLITYYLLQCGKSYSLCFKHKCSIFNRPVFTLNHLDVPTVNQSKYLGIIIRENICVPDLKRQMSKLHANVNRNRLVSFHDCILISICSSTVLLYSIIWAWWVLCIKTDS